MVLHGNTALHVAALTGNAAEVSRLLAEGAEIVENEFGKLPEDVASNDSIVSVLRGAALCVWQLDNCSECVSGSHSRAALVLIADWVFCNLSAARKEQTKAAMAELRALRVRVKDVSHTDTHTPCAGFLCL